MANLNVRMSDEEYEISQYLIYELVSPEFKEFIKSDILPSLGETLIENYKVSQKIATLKNRLIEDNIIKEDCK